MGITNFFRKMKERLAGLKREGEYTLMKTDAHRELFDHFISQNNIAVRDLYSFIIKDVKEFEEQTMRYAFDEYDDAFYKMEPIESYLLPFVRANLARL